MSGLDYRFSKRRSAVAVLCLVFAAAATADEAFVGKMLDCRALLSADERLLCYDGRVDEYSARGARPAAATSPESTGADDTSGAEESFGLPPAASSRTKVDQIDATIVELSRTASGKFVIELANGQVWRQTTSSSLRLAEGDLVVIRRGSLGSHKLTKADTNRSMKVTRVK